MAIREQMESTINLYLEERTMYNRKLKRLEVASGKLHSKLSNNYADRRKELAEKRELTLEQIEAYNKKAASLLLRITKVKEALTETQTIIQGLNTAMQKAFTYHVYTYLIENYGKFEGVPCRYKKVKNKVDVDLDCTLYSDGTITKCLGDNHIEHIEAYCGTLLDVWKSDYTILPKEQLERDVEVYQFFTPEEVKQKAIEYLRACDEIAKMEEALKERKSNFNKHLKGLFCLK